MHKNVFVFPDIRTATCGLDMQNMHKKKLPSTYNKSLIAATPVNIFPLIIEELMNHFNMA